MKDRIDKVLGILARKGYRSVSELAKDLAAGLEKMVEKWIRITGAEGKA